MLETNTVKIMTYLRSATMSVSICYEKINTYVVSLINIFIIFVLVKSNKIAINKMINIIMTANRALTLFKKLQITTKTKKKMIKIVISVRVIRIIKNSKMYTFEFLEILRRQF